MNIMLRSRQRRQPQGALRPAYAGGLGHGAMLLVPMWAGGGAAATDLVEGFAFSGSGSIVQHTLGLSWAGNGSQRLQSTVTSPKWFAGHTDLSPKRTPFSVAAFCWSTDTANAQYVFTLGSTAVNDPVVALTLDGSSAGDPGFFWHRADSSASALPITSNGYVANEPAMLVGRAGMSTYFATLNGVVGGSGTDTGLSSITFGGGTDCDRVSIGCLGRGSDAFFLTGGVYWVAYWPYDIGAEAQHELQEHPFMLFAAAKSPTYSLAGTASGAALAGTGSISLTGTANLSAGPLVFAGTANFSLTGSANLGSFLFIESSAGFSFDGAATLTALGAPAALGGVGQMSMTGTANLTAPGANPTLTASGSMGMSGVATLTGSVRTVSLKFNTRAGTFVNAKPNVSVAIFAESRLSQITVPVYVGTVSIPGGDNTLTIPFGGSQLVPGSTALVVMENALGDPDTQWDGFVGPVRVL